MTSLPSSWKHTAGKTEWKGRQIYKAMHSLRIVGKKSDTLARSDKWFDFGFSEALNANERDRLNLNYFL